MLLDKDKLKARKGTLKRMIKFYEKEWYDTKTVSKVEAKARLCVFRVKLELINTTLE